MRSLGELWPHLVALARAKNQKNKADPYSAYPIDRFSTAGPFRSSTPFRPPRFPATFLWGWEAALFDEGFAGLDHKWVVDRQDVDCRPADGG